MRDIHSEFKLDIKNRFTPLEKSLIKISDDLEKYLNNSLVTTIESNIYWDMVKSKVNAYYSMMLKEFKKWSTYNVPLRFRSSLRSINSSIKNNKFIIETPNKNVNNLIQSNVSSRTMGSLHKNTTEYFAQALLSGRKDLYVLINNIQRSIINYNLFKGVTDNPVIYKETKQDIDDGFNAISKQHFVTVKGRRYTSYYYSEILARVAFHEAQSQAALLQANNYGTNLIQISSHNTTTEICQQFEGKIFSISGKDKRFPQLLQMPPFHPNCIHLSFPTFESAMIVQGTMESFSAFSLGKISKPPVPSNWKPIKERKIA